MQTPVRVFAGPAELGEALAEEVLAGHAAARADGRPFLLGCPGGRSLRSTYGALAAARADLRGLVIVMMDEYLVVVDGMPRAVPPDRHYSCAGFAAREVAGPLGISPEDVWLPDPAAPDAYDDRIAAAGGIDLFLLACGASDGHVGFVPPGSNRNGRTSVVALAETTRLDNLATFPGFGSLGDVPRYGVTVGLGTIAALSKRVRLVLHGAGKRAAAARLLSMQRFDPSWPASIVYDCADGEIWLDREALGREEP